MSHKIQKIAPQRFRSVSLTRGNVAPIFSNRTSPLGTGLVGWGARTRTWEWRNQNPLPYHLATPQQAARCHHGARTIAARLGPINGRRQYRRVLDGPRTGVERFGSSTCPPSSPASTNAGRGNEWAKLRDGNSAVVARGSIRAPLSTGVAVRATCSISATAVANIMLLRSP